MTGYRPNYSLLDILGINYSTDELCIPVHDKQYLETNRKGIYVAGVVCAGLQTSKLFIENSRIHCVSIVCANVMAVAIQLAYLVFTGNERATVDSLSPHGNSLLLSMIQASTVCDD